MGDEMNWTKAKIPNIQPDIVLFTPLLSACNNNQYLIDKL